LLQGPDGIKLSDFGIASLFASRHLTVTGGVVGTAEYLSPEQAAGKPVTPRSDLYSLGVVLYTLVTGRNPFEGEVTDLLHKHRFAQFEKPSRWVPGLPNALEELLCELLEKDPARRPADAGVLGRRLEALRRRLEYKATQAAVATQRVGGLLAGGEGPATLMSRLVRAELERQNRGGPVRRFLNRPWVVVTLFVLCVGALVWALRTPSAESLYERGAALMNSADPDDWYTGWNDYLEPLTKKYPDYPHREEVAKFRRQYESYAAARHAALQARNLSPMSEAQWFYQLGVRQRQQGDAAGARLTWQALIDAFGDVPAELPWVQLARTALEGDKEDPERKFQPVRDALERARQLRAQGKGKEADAVLDALRRLYRNDPVAQDILKGD
jgi:hypothetical protein